MHTSSSKRRRRFVTEGPQGRMLGFVMRMMAVMAFVVIALMAAVFIYRQYAAPQTEMPWWADLLLLLPLGLLFCAVVVLCIAIRYTHRVAGGLPRLQRAAQQARAGDLTANLRLRKGDELHDLSQELQNMLDGFAGLAQNDRRSGAQIAEELRDLIRIVNSNGDISDKEALISRLRSLEAKAAAVAHHYRIARDEAEEDAG